LSATSFKDLAAFAAKLKAPQDTLSTYLRAQLSPATVQLVDNPETNKRQIRAYNQKLGAALAEDLNRVLQSNTFYNTGRFPQPLTPHQQRLQRLGAGEVARFNRALLSGAYPAEVAGLPRRARLVGTVLRQTPSARGLPWYRVINAGGRISFPVGSDAYARQRHKLEAEGVVFVGGRVDLRRYGWPSRDQQLDELLWKPG
jgi:methylated-DNA-protein-cysteine methyltransferase-like protein